MGDNNSSDIFGRTLSNIRSAWRGVTTGKLSAIRPHLPDSDRSELRKLIQECLKAKGGQVSGRARAAALGEAYLSLDDTGRQRYLEILAHEFGVDQDTVVETAQDIDFDASLEQQLEYQSRLRKSLTAPRIRLLTRFNSLPRGIEFLTNMRADLLRFLDDDPLMRDLEADLKALLRSWFDVGFLDLKRITWDAPASLLEKLIAYEAVHEIQSWDDLKNRLDSDRRCYAFFHPSIPDEPLVFIQVALVKGVANNIQVLLDENAPIIDAEKADTAIFYSITSTQRGLKGVHLGSFLIKQVVDDLAHELINLKTYSTLSPVPGLYNFISKTKPEDIATDNELKKINAIFPDKLLGEILSLPDWHKVEKATTVLKKPLRRACAEYLMKQKHRGRAVDQVANFHLNNGARLERMNWLADTSNKGLKESGSIMVNYLYNLSNIEQHHEKYRLTGETTVSSDVKSLLKR